VRHYAFAAAVAYASATAAAKAFGVGPSQSVPFDPEQAKRDIKGEGDVRTTAATRGRRGAVAAEGAKE